MFSKVIRITAVTGGIVLGAAGVAGVALASNGSATATSPISGCVRTGGTPARQIAGIYTDPARFAAHPCAKGSFAVTWNTQGAQGPQGPSGVVGNSSTDLVTTPQSIGTGGPFVANSTEIGTVTLPSAGTYLLTFNAKATPNEATGGAVFPQFFIYDQASNSAFTGDELNVGAGSLESYSATNAHDSYFSGTGQVVAPAGGETLHVYAFGYDSDQGAGTYALDTATLTATQIQVSS